MGLFLPVVVAPTTAAPVKAIVRLNPIQHGDVIIPQEPGNQSIKVASSAIIKGKSMRLSCFMCDRGATSDDHIPPKCFFPEQKDVPKGKNYRVNLITVPSCEDHNLKTSKDDEYIWSIIALHWQNHPEVQEYSTKKIKRALARNKKFFYLLFGEQNKYYRFTHDNEDLIAVTLDINRISKSMQKIAAGVYYNHFQKKWKGEILIHPRSLTAILNELNPVLYSLIQIAELARAACLLEEKYGSNKEVFYYQLIQDNTEAPPIMRLVFYFIPCHPIHTDWNIPKRR
jgi:hypothetical protein